MGLLINIFFLLKIFYQFLQRKQSKKVEARTRSKVVVLKEEEKANFHNKVVPKMNNLRKGANIQSPSKLISSLPEEEKSKVSSLKSFL
ncbi:unnamed protein product [Moneuplotes crassus]|uniref:ATP synthase F0 subunit 8 n=1 Tax=Euplotes crassus TaxID=5936 RepID=A0AAD1XMB7_EUPCR|nr:unnamed protein product [Moneuplotes crassus]